MHLPVVGARPEPPPRGSGLLELLERPFLALERLVDRAIPARLNPFLQTGAVANWSFLIAVLSGVLLLFWYVPSVNQAYESLEAARAQPLGGQLVRSLHRYSSDACMLFVILHAVRYTVGRRFGGPRWLAWVTGIAAVAILWLVGWLGYWLVWDERAQLVATGSVRMLDVLPIFAEPVGRSFLVDQTVNSLLFFVVFFAHMMIPLVCGVFMWLHITRLSRPRFLGGWTIGLWVLGATIAVSLAWPATSAGAAAMRESPEAFSMDWWYLMPLALTDRLGGGVLWAAALGVGVVLFSMPWWATRGRARAASVEPSKCNACEQCVKDCPYGAITMVPRTDGRRWVTEARVDASKCVGCGICAGSCNTAGIGLPQLTVEDVRRNMDTWLEKARERSEATHVAFLCGSSAARDFRIDPATGACDELPGYLAWAVPCAGWVHALTVERAIRHGAAGVLIVTCGPGSCQFREGTTWTKLRMGGEREPELRAGKVDPSRVRILSLDPAQRSTLAREAAAFRQGTAGGRVRRGYSKGRMVAAAVVITAVLGAVTAVASDAPYQAPVPDGPELVVSFAHPGATGEQCRDLTEEEKASRPIHMRQDRVCERGRSPVRLRIAIDGEVVHEQAHDPGGLFGDEHSVAIVRLPITPGRHQLDVAIGETRDPTEWTHSTTESVDIPERPIRRVLLFDRSRGFELF